jgi:hypothetical protein
MDIEGAALFAPVPFATRSGASLPYVIVISVMVSSVDYLVEVIALDTHTDGSLMKGACVAKQHFAVDDSQDKDFEGRLPHFLCLCCNNYAVIIHRNTGTIFFFKFSTTDLSLSLEDKMCLQAFVVDAAIRGISEPSEHLEITALILGPGRTMEGQLVLIHPTWVYPH